MQVPVTGAGSYLELRWCRHTPAGGEGRGGWQLQVAGGVWVALALGWWMVGGLSSRGATGERKGWKGWVEEARWIGGRRWKRGEGSHHVKGCRIKVNRRRGEQTQVPLLARQGCLRVRRQGRGVLGGFGAAVWVWILLAFIIDQAEGAGADRAGHDAGGAKAEAMSLVVGLGVAVARGMGADGEEGDEEEVLFLAGR